MSVPDLLRRGATLAVLTAALSCEHTPSFVATDYAATSPLVPGNPAQLTYNTGVDTRASWLPDGSAFLYTQEQTGSTDGDRCFAVMPKAGGTTIRTICATTDFAHDSTNDLESAAVDAGYRMTYVRTSMKANLGLAGPDHAAIVLGTFGTPQPGSVVHLLPYHSPSGEGIDMASDISWAGSSALVYLAEVLTYPSACGACSRVDTIRTGVEIDKVDLNGTISVVVDSSAGFPTSAKVVGGDTLYYTLTGSGAIHRRLLSTSVDTVVYDYGVPATDVSAAAGRLAIVVGNVSLHVLTLATSSDQTLANPTLAVLAHPALDPTGHLVVADATDFGLANLLLWTVP